MAVSKLTLSAASLSSTGPRTFLSPLYPVLWARHSSARMNSTFGFAARARSIAGAAASAVRRTVRRGIAVISTSVCESEEDLLLRQHQHRTHLVGRARGQRHGHFVT